MVHQRVSSFLKIYLNVQQIFVFSATEFIRYYCYIKKTQPNGISPFWKKLRFTYPLISFLFAVPGEIRHCYIVLMTPSIYDTLTPSLKNLLYLYLAIVLPAAILQYYLLLHKFFKTKPAKTKKSS